MKWLDGITDSMDMSLSKLWEMRKDSKAWRAEVHGVTESRTQLSEQLSTCINRNSACFPDLSLLFASRHK